jgi:hypothetical protein
MAGELMPIGIKGQFYRDFLNSFRKGGWGEEGKVAYDTMSQGAKTDVKDILRAMSEEKVAEGLKKPLKTMPAIDYAVGNKSLADDLKSYASYNWATDELKLPPFVLNYPSTIPHEIRHAQQVRPSFTRKRPTIFETGDDFDPMYNITEGSISDSTPLAKRSVWDVLYNDRSNPVEVDAMLSEYTTKAMAGRISDARKITKSGSIATPQNWEAAKQQKKPTGIINIDLLWDRLPAFAKKHYVETASLAGLGFMSQGKLQGED